MQSINSSNLVEAERNPDDTVKVRFKNGLYQSIKPVPMEVWQRFESTFQTKDSSGQFFHQHLKVFDFQKVNG